jgi:Ssp1 endopeptidase immunity protein Rap1a
MRRLLLAIPIALTLIGSAMADSGNDLLARCSSTTEFSKSYCVGYVLGVAEQMLVRHVPLCLPHNAETHQLEDSVVLFLQDHPKLRAINAAALTAFALADEYPCPESRR